MISMTNKKVITTKRFIEAGKELEKVGAVPVIVIAVNVDAADGNDTFLFPCHEIFADLYVTVELMEKIIQQIKQKE